MPALEWTKELKADDLPGDLQLVAQECGIEVALILAEKLPSISIYVRPINGLVAAKKEAYIRKHFNGGNHKELALAVGCSDRWIYKLLEGKKEEDRQIGLFNEMQNRKEVIV